MRQLSFNEAGARAPRIPCAIWMYISAIQVGFNEAGARAPRIPNIGHNRDLDNLALQ